MLHIQNPAVSYVATIGDWEKNFNRYIKRDARPLVILQPFGPVMFVYDILDTEGAAVPEALVKPFNTKGRLPYDVFGRTVHNCHAHRIEVRDDLKGLHNAGKAIRLNAAACELYRDLCLPAETNYLVLLNKDHSSEEKYSTLVHELGHIFCGHLGIDDLAWWESNTDHAVDVKEIEAESVSYLVCMRQGLTTNSEQYRSDYRTPGLELPAFGINAVLQATDYIEKMGESRWKEPKRKAKKVSTQKTT